MKKSDNLLLLKIRRLLTSFRDHGRLIFKSAAHNHLRIQEIRRGQHGGIFCTISFNSYTALKEYQKKVRVVSFGLTSGLAMFIVGLVLIPVFFDPSGSKAAGEAPIVSSVSPTSGPEAGGTSVTISGSYFTPLVENSGGNTGWVNTGVALPSKVTAAQVAVIGNYIYIFGGYYGSTYLNTIYSAPISDPTNFTNTGKTLPGVLAASQLAVIGNTMYLFGGQTAGSTYSNVIYSAPVSDPTTWTNTTKTLPSNVAYSQVAVIGNYVYLFGGYLGGTNGQSIIYRASISDPMTWTNTGSTLPGMLGLSQLAIIDNYVYLFGGFVNGGSSYSSVIYRAAVSDPTTWTNTGSVLPAEVFGSQLAVIGDKIYLFGGYRSTSLSIIYSAPVSSPTTWTNTGNVLPSVLEASNLAVVGANIYLYGGYTSTDVTAIYRSPLQQNRPNKYMPSWKTSWQTYSTLGTQSANVSIGGNQALNNQYIDSNTISVFTPAHVAGSTDVVVTNPDGQSSTLTNGYTYNAAPTISGISPSSGSKNGGDSVTISGTGFYGSPSVKLGGVDAASVFVVNSTTITAITPAHTTGQVDILITNPDAQSVTLSNGFTFVESAPSLSSIDPTSGPITGNTSVIINGSNFAGGSDSYTKLLLHADGNANSFVDSSSFAKTVTVTGNATQSTVKSKFGGKSAYFDGSGDYLQVADSDDWDFGSGNFTVDMWAARSVTGVRQYLIDQTDSAGANVNTSFMLEYTAANKLQVTAMNAVTPLSNYIQVASTAAVTDNNWHHVAMVRNGTALNVYLDGVPVISTTINFTVNPSAQPLSVGAMSSFGLSLNGYLDEVRISKGIARWTSDFSASLSTSAYAQPNVTFGGAQARDIVATSSATITAKTPAHITGITDVVVTNYDNQSSTLTNGYTYNAAPTISGVTPNAGSKNGGDSITITGTGFYGSPNVKLGGTDTINVTVVNSTTIIATTPAHAGGQVDVIVTNPDSQSVTLSNGFNFIEPAPSISSIDPTSGPISGGTSVTITGSNFSAPDLYTKLLLHADGQGNAFTDASLTPKAVTAGGTITQTSSQYKFGGSCINFDGSGTVYAASSPDWSFGLDDFTIDSWIYLTNDSFPVSYKAIVSSHNGGVNEWWFGFYNWKLRWYLNGEHVGPTSVTPNVWHHVAMVRNSGTSTIYLDGSVEATWADGNNYQTSNTLWVGGQGNDTTSQFKGYMDELRISKGVARWASSFNSSLPSVPYYKPQVIIGGLQATNIFPVDSSTITATTQAHVAGPVDVQVINDDGQSSTLTNGYTYIGPPVVTSISPSSVTNNQNVSGVTISGAGFQNGATVKFKKSGESDIVCSNVVFNSSTSLSCDGDFHGIAPGNWDIQVTNADLQVGTGSALLNVTSEVTKIVFTTPAYTIKPNIASQSVRIQLQDSGDRATNPNSEIIADLTKSSLTGEFSLSRTSWSPISSVTFATSENTKTIYYKDSTLGSYTIGANENPSQSWTDATQAIIISNNAPFVWPFDVSGDYQYDNLKVGISTSDAKLVDLASVNPEIQNTSSAALTYSSLSSFSEVLDTDNQGTIKYQLSNNNGTTWYWWNGSTWVSTTQGSTEANGATTINAHISTFNSAIGQIGNANLSFKAFLIGDGNEQVSLDSIFVGYTLFPYKYSFIQKPTSLNETEEGTFVVQAQDQNGNVIVVDHDTVISLTTSAPATGFFATNLSEDISTRWDKQTVTIPAGQSSATFYYKDSLKGSKTISANPPGGESSIAASYALNVTSKYRFLVTGISDPIKQGVPSSVTVQAADYLGNLVTSYTGTIHFSSSDSVASLPANYDLTAPMLGGKTFVNGVTMMTQGEQCVTVADISDSNITGSQCAVTVTSPPAGVVSKLKIVSAPQFVTLGETSSSITVQLQDINGDAAVKDTPTTIYVYRTTASGQFSADGTAGWTSGAFSVSIPAGATSANFFYKDTTAGNYNVTVSDDNVEGQDLALTNDTQQLSAVSGNPYAFSFNSGSANIVAGTVSGALNFSLHDNLGNQVTTQISQAAIITSSNGGEFSLDGISNWTSKLTTSISTGQFENNFYYRNNTSGNDSITISDSDPADGATGLVDSVFVLNVHAAGIASFAYLNSPVNVNIGDVSSELFIQARDIYGNVAVAAGDTNIYLYSDKSGTTFSQSFSPFISVDHITIPNGESVASFFFKQSVDNGSIAITASDNAAAADGNAGIQDVSQTESISQGEVTSFVITNTSPLQLNAGEESVAITVESRNGAGIKIPVSGDTTIYFHTDSTASVKEFSLAASPSWNNISSAIWSAGNDSMIFYYKDTKTGNKTITFGDDSQAGAEAGITNAQLSVDVSSSPVSNLKVTSSPLTVEAGERGQLTIELQDQYGNAVNAESDQTINFSSNKLGTFTNSNSDVISTLVIASGSSSGQIYYQSEVIGTHGLIFSSNGLAGDSQNFEVVAGDPVIADLSIADSDIVAGDVSGVIQVKLYNSHNVLTTTPSDLTVNISKNSSTGKFDSNSNGSFSSDTLALVIASGSGSGEFYYKDTKSGAHAIYSDGSGLTEDSLNVSIQPAAIDHLNFTSSSQMITKGEVSNAITGKIYDVYENEITLAADLALNLATSSAAGEFSSAQSPWSSISSLTVLSGQDSFAFYYKDQTVNVVQLSVSSIYGTITQSQSIIEGQLQNDAPAKFLFQSAPQTLTINSASTFDFYLANSSNQYTASQGQLTATLTSDTATGRFYNGSSWVTSIDVNFQAGESVKSFQYKDSVSGNPILTIASAGLTSALQQEMVVNGSIEKIVLEAQSSANTVDRIPVVIKTMTNSDLSVAVSSNVSFALTQNGNGNFYASAGSQTPISSTTLTSGTSSKTIYFQQTTIGAVAITADENPSQGWTVGQMEINISSIPTRLRFTNTAQTKQAGLNSGLMNVTLDDIYGNVADTSNDLVLHLSSSSAFGQFSLSDTSWQGTSTVMIPQGSNSANFYYRDTLAGTQTLTVSDVSSPAENPDTGYINAQQTFTVTANDIYSLNLLIPAQDLEIGQVSSQITVQAQDQYGNAKIVDTDFDIYFYSTSANGKFSLSNDFADQNLLLSSRILTGTSTASFYYRDLNVGNFQLTVSDKNSLDNPDLGIINDSQQINVAIGDVAEIVWESVPASVEEGDLSDVFEVKTTNASGIEIPILDDLQLYLSVKDFTTGSFGASADGPWGISSVLIPAGNSRANFYYKDTADGTRLLTVSDEPIVSENSDSGLVNAKSYVNILQGAITAVVFQSAPQTITANHPSNAFQINTVNKSDIPSEVDSDRVIYLRSSSATGEFSADGSNWGANGIIISGGSYSGTFYYRDATSGTYTLTAADTLPLSHDLNWTNAMQTVVISPQQLDHFNIRNISDPQKQGTPSSLVVSPVDGENYVIKEYAGTITTIEALDSNGNSEPAILPDLPYTFDPIVDKGIKTFTNSVAFYSEGEKTVMITDSNGFTGSQTSITVVGASTNSIAKVRFIDTTSPLTVVKRTISSLITVQLQDDSGNPTNVSASSGYGVKIISSNGSGEFSIDGVNWSSKEIILNVKQNINYATFYYRNDSKVDDELIAQDWNGEVDEVSISNDSLQVNVTAGEAMWLQITGASSMVAGNEQEITITAKDQDGDTVAGYEGDKELIFAGANAALTLQNPTCSNKNTEDVEFGQTTLLAFVNGEAATKLKLYRKEIAEIKVEDGTLNTYGNSSRDLTVNVLANIMSKDMSVLSATPNPQQVGAPVIVTVIPKDVYGNMSGKSAFEVVMNVSGANTISSQSFTFDDQTGNYQTTYSPQNPGTDLISATLNGLVIKQDSEAVSEGIIHQQIEGAVIATECGYIRLNTDESSSDKLVFDTCIGQDQTEKSDEISKSQSRGTSLAQLELKIENYSSNFSDQINILSYSQKPSAMQLSADYLDQAKYIPYIFWKVETDGRENDVKQSVYRIIVSNQWITDNEIVNFFAIDDMGEVLVANKVDSSSDNSVFEISSNGLPHYLALLGQKEDQVIIAATDDKNETSDATQPGNAIDYILRMPGVATQQSTSNDNEGKYIVSDTIADLFGLDNKKAGELTNLLAIVSTGAAAASIGVATAASFPMLSYVLGAIRTASAVPYRRKQKWGVVYDSQTGHPLSSALVIISDENGRVKEMKNTDQSGFYSFLVPKGTYIIDVRKSGYSPAKNSHIVSFETYYDNSYICGENIELEQEDIISLNIPMLKQDETFWQKVFNPATMTHAIFWIGFSFSVFALVITPSYFNIGILMLFVANFLLNAFYRKHLRLGKVFNKEMKPAGFASVKIFDKEGKLLARTVANEKGSYVLVMNEGEYIIEAQSGSFKCSKEISLPEHAEIKENLILETEAII